MRKHHLTFLLGKVFIIGLLLGYKVTHPGDNSVFTQISDTFAQPSIETQCLDGHDNDDDGNIDCADRDCQKYSYCSLTENSCMDNIDNDADGKVDCADSDCSTNDTCEAVCGDFITQYPENCDDGNKLNGDGCNTQCKRETPSCQLTTSLGTKPTQAATLTLATANTQQDNRIQLKSIQFGDSANTITYPTLPVKHTYKTPGSYTITATLTNKLATTKINGQITQETSKICNLPVTIKAKFGCTDTKATNHDQTATIDNGTCTYDNAPLLRCSDIRFSTNNDNPLPGQEIQFGRITNPYIDNVRLDPDTHSGETLANLTSPYSFTYDQLGIYKPSLIISDSQGQMIHCTQGIHVGTRGCGDPYAENYNPDTTFDNLSCLYSAEPGYLDIISSSLYNPTTHSIQGQLQYNGDPSRIQVVITISDSQGVVQQTPLRLQPDGSFVRPLDDSIGSPYYLPPGRYTLTVTADHYREMSTNARAQQELYLGVPLTCGNGLIDGGEECDGQLTCDNTCRIYSLNDRQKDAIAAMTHELIAQRQNDGLRAAYSNHFQTVQRMVETGEITATPAQLYSLSYIISAISSYPTL